MKYSREILPPLTDFFDYRTKPMHIGVYRVAFGRVRGFSYWNGAEWGGTFHSSHEAAVEAFLPGGQNKHWQGLTEHVA